MECKAAASACDADSRVGDQTGSSSVHDHAQTVYMSMLKRFGCFAKGVWQSVEHSKGPNFSPLKELDIPPVQRAICLRGSSLWTLHSHSLSLPGSAEINHSIKFYHSSFFGLALWVGFPSGQSDPVGARASLRGAATGAGGRGAGGRRRALPALPRCFTRENRALHGSQPDSF